MKFVYSFLRLGFFCALMVQLFSTNKVNAQCVPCGAVTFTVNLSSKPDTAWVQNGPVRSGTCCTGSQCVNFVVYLNPGSDLLSFDVTNPSPSGSAFYQINCGPQISIGTPACVPGGASVICITYCKPGGDKPDYHITASKTVKSSPDFTLRAGCAQTMTVGGLSVPTITWTSISPGTLGQYNSYLSCTVGCATTTINPPVATPSVIYYQVAGSPISGCPGVNKDTVKVTIVPGMSVNITPTNPVVCSGGTGSVVLTATASGGQSPYTYTWSSGPNTQTVNVIAGNYTVMVNDATSGCTAITKTINVAAITTPTAPTVGSNSPICAGQTLSLSASTQTGVTYSWTGPNSFTSAVQNPTIASAGTVAAGVYSVIASFSGCISPPGTGTVVVNPIPSTPTAGANSPVCVGQTLSLTSSTIAGATYNWSGPNSFTSNVQNPSISGITTAGAGVYSVSATAGGCTGNSGTVAVTVNTVPIAPTAGANSPICAGQTLSLTASAIAGATYSWTGPNTFTSNVQNPTIAGATTLAAGVYSVRATVGGCAGPFGTVNVVVNPIPSAPTASASSPICAGATLSLSASTIAGATYNWSGPNTFTSNVQNPNISGATTAASGVYSVNVTVAGCAGPSGTVSATVSPVPATPTLSSNSPVCAGQNINLTASNVAGATYSWSGPNSFTANVQNPTITGAGTVAAGVYSVNATVAGCAGANGTINVVVNPIPGSPIPGSNSPICAGSTLSLTASTIAGATYNWSGPNSFTSNVQNPTIAGTGTVATGVYSVNVTVAGCTGTNSTISVTVNPIPVAPVVGSNSPLC
jgi:hypothetical protein